MSSCTVCGRPVDRELSRDEEEGGYAYCDRCEDRYHQQMNEEEERLSKEGRSLYGEYCGYCGRLRSWDEVNAGGDCRCGGADAYDYGETFLPTPEEVNEWEENLKRIVNQLGEEPPF